MFALFPHSVIVCHIAIGQIYAADVKQNGKNRDNYHFDEYFNSRLDEDSDIEGKKVGYLLTFRKANWTSYGDNSITFAWNNVKYLNNFEFSNTLTQMIVHAFITNTRLTNKLYLYLPGFETDKLGDLVEGKNIGRKAVNANLNEQYHSKVSSFLMLKTALVLRFGA